MHADDALVATSTSAASVVASAAHDVMTRMRREPALSTFEAAIAEKKQTADEVAAMPVTMVRGWLKLDAKPGGAPLRSNTPVALLPEPRGVPMFHERRAPQLERARGYRSSFCASASTVACPAWALADGWCLSIMGSTMGCLTLTLTRQPGISGMP